MASEILLENVSIQGSNSRTVGRRGKGVGINDNLIDVQVRKSFDR